MNIILFDRIDGLVKYNSEIFKHIVNILHLKPGDTFKCGEWGVSKGVARIEKITSEGIIYNYSETTRDKSSLNVYLLISYIRPICAKRVVRFVGECQCAGIIFTQTKLGEKSYKESSFYKDEYIKVLRQGCEISSDFAKPKIIMTNSLQESIDCLNDLNVVNKFLLEKCDDSLKLIKPDEKCSVVAIGGERGWKKNEIEFFQKNNFQIRNIGKKIIRSEESAILSLYPWL